MRAILTSIVLLCLCLGLFLAAPTRGHSAIRDVSGRAAWDYAEWQRSEGGKRVGDAHHFLQQYSLLFNLKDQIKEGRGGKYDLNLGYDWSSADSVVDLDGQHNTFDIQTAKLLYRGDLVLAPGGLPFYMHAYSRDMSQPLYFRNGFGLREDFEDLRPDIFTDLSDGTRVESGLTMVAGIRNGHYLGAYRDFLSRFPKLYIDYKQSDVNDLKGETPQKYRERDLAFVSLNKKDNWFHYRFHDYRDKLNPQEDYEEWSLRLGTVDHLMVRQWINLTNWVQISTDGVLTKTDRARQSLVPDETERYDLNLFAKMSLARWKLASFSNFQHIRDSQTLEKHLELPVFADGQFSADSSWRLTFIGDNQQNVRSAGPTIGEEQNLRDYYLATRIETGRQSSAVAAPFINLELRQDDLRGDGQGIRVGAEWYTNRAYRPVHSLFGRLSVTDIEGGGNVTIPEKTSYQEYEGTGRIQSRWSSILMTEARQTLLVGSGTLDRQATIHIKSGADTQLYQGGNEGFVLSGDTLRSTTLLAADWRWRSRTGNRLEMVLDYLNTDTKSATQWTLSDRFNADRRFWQLDMLNEIILGSDVTDQTVTNGSRVVPTGALAISAGRAKSQLLHRLQYDYSTGRVWNFRLLEKVQWVRGDLQDVLYARLEQHYQYNIFTVNGFVRRLAVFNQEFDYDAIEGSAGAKERYTTFTLAGNYYPIKVLLLSAKLRHRYFFEEEQQEWTYFLDAGLHFQKLSIDLQYAYGQREASVSEAQVMEHRWEVQVKKTF